MPGPIDLPLDALEVVTGGASQRLFTDAGAGVRPDHHYGLASDTFSVTAGGGRTQFEVVNDLIQRFNAPTGDALYRAGNDPGADFGVVSRPGAQYVEGTRDSVGVPLDWGGNVTLMHGDGFARNTTIDGAHPLTGTITRNAVVDLNEGGGFQVLTLGRGEGLHNQPADSLPGKIATALETPYANLSHLANPELGYQAFSRLDAALIASSQGQASPNLAERGGMFSEGWGALTALGNGMMTAAGFNQPSPTGTPQQQLVYDVARELNQTGPVDGFFVQSSVLPGVYHVGPEGSTYYERGADGRPQVTQVDEFAGVDQAVARQAALAESSPPPAPAQDVQVPMPPEVGPPQLDPPSAPGDGGPRIDNQAAPAMPGDGGGDRGGAGGGGEVVNEWNGDDGRGGGGAGWGGGGSAGDGGGSDRGGEGGDWSGGGGGDWGGGGGGDWGGGGE